jgi:hypothetical protein
MAVILDAIIGGIAWEAFSKSLSFYAEEANNFVLRVYIAQQLKALEQLEGATPKQIEEVTNIIETSIVETPEEIKQIKEPQKQKEAFEAYFKENPNVRKIQAENYFESIVAKDGGTVNLNFGGSTPK